LIRLLEPEQQHLLALRYGADLDFDEIAARGTGTRRIRYTGPPAASPAPPAAPACSAPNDAF
jgi:hypothetical protein